MVILSGVRRFFFPECLQGERLFFRPCALIACFLARSSQCYLRETLQQCTSIFFTDALMTMNRSSNHGSSSNSCHLNPALATPFSNTTPVCGGGGGMYQGSYVPCNFGAALQKRHEKGRERVHGHRLVLQQSVKRLGRAAVCVHAGKRQEGHRSDTGGWVGA